MTTTSFAQNSAPRLFYWLLQQQFEGRLRVDLEREKPFSVLFRAGLPWFCDRYDQHALLGEILLKRKLITWDQLQQALLHGARGDLRLGEQLVAEGLLDAKTLGESLAWQCEHKLLPLFALDEGRLRLQTATTATDFPRDLSQGVNSLHLIMQGLRLHWPLARIRQHRAKLEGQIVALSPAFSRYQSHFSLNQAEMRALEKLRAGFCVGDASSDLEIERLIFALWNCNMLQAQSAPAHARSASGRSAPQSAPSPRAASSAPRQAPASAPRERAKSAGHPSRPRSPDTPASPPGRPADRSSAPPNPGRPPSQGRPGAGKYSRPQRRSRSAHTYRPPGPSSSAEPSTPAANDRPPRPASSPRARKPAPTAATSRPRRAETTNPAAPRSAKSSPGNPSPRSAPPRSTPPAGKPAPGKSAQNSAPCKIASRRLKKNAAANDSGAKKGQSTEDRRQFLRDLEAVEALVKAEANAFSLFDLSLDADRRAVRKRWSELSRRYHPDTLSSRNMGDLKSRVQHVFAYLSAGYQTLSHPKKRAELKKALEAGCENIGAGEDAAQVVRRALEAEGLVKKAEKLVKKQHFEKAASLFQKALSMESKDPNAAAGLAWCEFNLSSRAESEAQQTQQKLQAICNDHPNCADAHYFLGLVALQRQAHNTARSALNKALEINPRLIDAERQLRILKVKQSQASAAPKKRGLFG